LSFFQGSNPKQTNKIPNERANQGGSKNKSHFGLKRIGGRISLKKWRAAPRELKGG